MSLMVINDEYRQQLREEFFKKTHKAICWLWTGEVKNGYALFKIHGRKIRAQRAIIILDGKKIPERYIVLTTCENALCVNPDHLRLVPCHSRAHLKRMADEDHKKKEIPKDEVNTFIGRIGKAISHILR